MRTKKFFKSSFARSAETFVSMVAGLILLPIMIQQLGTQLYGIWIIIGSLTTALYIFDIGMAASVTRFLAYALSQNDRENASQLLSTAFAIYSGLACLIVLTSFAVAGLSPFLIEDQSQKTLIQLLILIVGLTIAIEFPFKAYAGVAGYHLRQDLLAYSHIFFRITSATVMVILLFQGYKLLAVALVGLVSSFLSNFVFLAIAKYLEPDVKVKIRYVTRAKLNEILSFSAWTFLIDLSRLIKKRGDIWILAAIISTPLITIYYVSLRLAEYLGQFVMRAVSITLPLYTEAVAQKNYKELERKALLFIRLNTMLAMFLFSGTLLFGADVIRLWMGGDFDYQMAHQVMIILMIGKLIVFISAPHTNILFAMAKHKYQALVSAIETAGSLCLIPLFVLVFDLGLTGACLAVIAPFPVTRIFVFPYLVQRHSGVSAALFYRSVMRIITPYSVVVYLSYVSYQSVAEEPGIWLLFLFISGFSFFILLFNLCLLTPEERGLVSSIFSREKQPKVASGKLFTK